MAVHRPRPSPPLPTYVCYHNTQPPADQVIRTDTENLLLRHLRLKRAKEMPATPTPSLHMSLDAEGEAQPPGRAGDIPLSPKRRRINEGPRALSPSDP